MPEALPRRVLMDASLYVFRAYHSRAPDWHDHQGEPTHAVHGFVSTLFSLLERSKPSHIAVCFDGSLNASFRNEIDPSYKANRERPDANLLLQFDYCRRFSAALGLRALIDSRYEADDLIATLAATSRADDLGVLVISADKDLGQVIGPKDRQWDFTKGEPYGPDGVFKRSGVRPDQVADLLALTGDPVDNIKGIAGIGPKTAAQLLAHFGTLEQLIARAGEVPFLRSVRGAQTLLPKLRSGFVAARLARQLTLLAEDAPVPLWSELVPGRVDQHAFDCLCDAAGFGQLLRARARRWSDANS